MLLRSTITVQARVVELMKPKKARLSEGISAEPAVCADAEDSKVWFIGRILAFRVDLPEQPP